MTGATRRRVAPYRHGIRSGLGFAAAAFVMGVSFGVIAQPIIGSAAAIVMSAVLFAGASQFGAVTVLAAGGGAATAIATGAMLNARYLPMGVAAASALRGPWRRRALEGQAIVDTSWALAGRGGGAFDRELMLGASLSQYPAWVLGTAAGALCGGVLGDPAALGLDAILPAFLLGLLAAELRRPHATAAALIGGAVALALTPLLPVGLPMLLASVGALIGLHR